MSEGVPPTENKSEVATLMAQIDAAFQAGRQAINGLSLGSAQHAFITARMAHMGEMMIHVREKYGDAVAMQVMKAWDHAADSTASPGSRTS